MFGFGLDQIWCQILQPSQVLHSSLALSALREQQMLPPPSPLKNESALFRSQEGLFLGGKVSWAIKNGFVSTWMFPKIVVPPNHPF